MNTSPAAAYGFGKFRTFGQKAVARMNGVRACNLGNTNDDVATQIALARRRRSDAISLVARRHMQAVASASE